MDAAPEEMTKMTTKMTTPMHTTRQAGRQGHPTRTSRRTGCERPTRVMAVVTLTRKGGEDPVTRARPTGYQHTQEGTTTPRTTRRTPSPRRGRLRLWRTPDDGGRKRRRGDGRRATPAADDGLSRTRGRQAGRRHANTLPTVLLCSPSLLSRLLDAARLEVGSVALRHDDRKARAPTRPTRTALTPPPSTTRQTEPVEG